MPAPHQPGRCAEHASYMVYSRCVYAPLSPKPGQVAVRHRRRKVKHLTLASATNVEAAVRANDSSVPSPHCKQCVGSQDYAVPVPGMYGAVCNLASA